jgi:hypothetical protein
VPARLSATDRHRCDCFVGRVAGPERDERAGNRDCGGEAPEDAPPTPVGAGTRREQAIQSLTGTLSSGRGPVLPRRSTRRTVRRVASVERIQRSVSRFASASSSSCNADGSRSPNMA